MQNREFEKKVQDQMEQLKFTPADAVWDKVEAGLPKEKDRRWIIFVLLFVALLTGSLFLWKNFTSDSTSINNTSNDAANHTTTATKETNSPTVKIENKKNNTNVNTSDTNLLVNKIEMPVKTDNNQVLSDKVNKKSGTSACTKIKVRKGNAATAETISEEDVTDKNKSALKTKATVKVKTKAPQSVAENEAIVAVPMVEEKLINKIIDTLTVNTVKADSLIAENKINVTDTIAIVKKDTAVTAKKRPTKNNKKKWQYGIDVAAGSSAVKTGLFNSTVIYADAYSSSVSGSPGTGISNGANKTSMGFTFSGGFYATRVITDKWKFKTGINYWYQSNMIKVGSKVDSAASFRFDTDKSISARNYYRNGNSESYKNYFHLLEIPLIFEYHLSKKSPLNIEVGPTVSYLISSNALVYSSSSSVYFTDKNIFNKLLLSVNAGAGFTVAKQSKWPITIGCRFRYSLSSVVKTSLSKQHFVNSMLYLKIPFKK